MLDFVCSTPSSSYPHWCGCPKIMLPAVCLAAVKSPGITLALCAESVRLSSSPVWMVVDWQAAILAYLLGTSTHLVCWLLLQSLSLRLVHCLDFLHSSSHLAVCLAILEDSYMMDGWIFFILSTMIRYHGLLMQVKWNLALCKIWVIMVIIS